MVDCGVMLSHRKYSKLANCPIVCRSAAAIQARFLSDLDPVVRHAEHQPANCTFRASSELLWPDPWGGVMDHSFLHRDHSARIVSSVTVCDQSPRVQTTVT